ncbi:MFS transporter [Amantichitinum ursilacus]|uniref:Inner membrane transport protein YdhP n=1 Tax=Amantichitinum ursilacus TaxID=857265 RepID=A0A0N1JRD8_9NEIS|nr:MFS transporter [Amantichitinum ursilacus]KPC49652.1 Inner membrane transport protein YdhP [Amantichitinum ursilacus]
MRSMSPLLALSIGAFGIGVTEFAPMGMLPGMASDLGVSIPTAGLLVSGYAMGVLLGAPFMTLTTTRVPRRTLLIALMAIFTLGNLMSALATSYTALLIARVVTSLCHGAFFGVGSVVATQVVAPEKRAGAVATMFMGLTIATIGGVPLATWVGDTLGWRSAFWGIAALGVMAMAALRYALPDVAAGHSDNVMAEIRVLGQRTVLSALALTVLGSSAMFTVFTYIAPILHEQTHASTGFVSAMLMLFGVGMTIGNLWSGKATDRAPDRTLIITLVALTVILLGFAVIMRWTVPAAITILFWGIASFAIVPPLQMRVMTAAAAAPNLASATNIGAFNLGNAIGAALGGAVIDAGLGYPAVSLAGAAMAASALVTLLLIKTWGRAPLASA